MSAKKKGLLSRNELLSCVFFPAFPQIFFRQPKQKKRKLTLSRNFYSKKDNPDLFFQPTPNQTKKRRRFIPTKHPTPRFHHHQGVVLVYVVVGGRNWGLGGDKTRIHWIGLWGVGSEHKRQAGRWWCDGGMVGRWLRGFHMVEGENWSPKKVGEAQNKDLLLVNFLGGDQWLWLSNMCVCFSGDVFFYFVLW